jgi:hypothetical protein
MSSRNSVVGVLALFTAIAGCKSDTNFTSDGGPPGAITDLDPDIDVKPARVKFDDLDVLAGVPETGLVTIENVGEGDLEIHDLYLTDDTAPFEIGTVGSVIVPPGSTTDFQVTFNAKTAATWKVDVLIDSNDPDEPTVPVRLVGTGLAPVIDVTPSAYDFGEPYIGCDIRQPYLVSNLGTAPLEISAFRFAAGSSDMSFDPNGEASRTVAPAESFEVYLDYKALDSFADKGYLTIFSNDPLTPETVVTATGTGTPFIAGADAYEQPLRSSSDILFIVDNSGSMGEEQLLLTENFDAFVSTLVDAEADFQLAVISTDSAEFRGRVISGDDADPVGSFQTQALIGTAGSGDERGTQMAYEATQPGGEAAPGSAFMRDRSVFSMVILSDEPDSSIIMPAPYTTEADYYDYFVNDVKGGDADAVKFHGIIGDVPTPSCTTAGAGTGYWELINLTGGTFVSICSTDWGSGLSAVAVGSVALNNTFELTNDPVPETIEVRIDGVLTTLGWTYNVVTNTVDFDPDFVPMGGSTVDIDYQLMPTCEG